MTYREFYTAAIKGVANYKTISKDAMEFSYLVFHKTFGEDPKTAVQSTLLLDTLK